MKLPNLAIWQHSYIYMSVCLYTHPLLLSLLLSLKLYHKHSPHSKKTLFLMPMPIFQHAFV